MNNMFPPINTHSRPPSEDLPGVSNGGIPDIHSASKHQQIRRQQQQTIDQQRRSPLRSNSLLTHSTTSTSRNAAAVAVRMPSSGQNLSNKSELEISPKSFHRTMPHKNNNSSSSSSRHRYRRRRRVVVLFVLDLFSNRLLIQACRCLSFFD